MHIPDSHRDLVEAPHLGVLSTVGPDDRPQVTAVWVLAEADSIRISLVNTRQKYRNIGDRPRATLFVIDPSDRFRTLEMRSDASIEDDGDLAFFDRIVRHYGHDPAAYPANREGRCTLTLKPTRVVTLGPSA